MKAFILMMFITADGGNVGLTQDFKTLESCEQAGVTFTAELSSSEAGLSTRWVCVER